MQTRLPAPVDVLPESLRLVACSLCLRVLHDSGWVEAAQAIRELRTFDLPAPVGLDPGLCDRCLDVVAERRAEGLADRSRAAA
jgi:hypothetical protein